MHKNKIFHEWEFDNSYSRLPPRFYQRLNPTKVKLPELKIFNKELGKRLGVFCQDVEQITSVFSGNEIPAGADPLAMAYAGHQFGSFVTQLGDGRAILLGEIKDKTGKLFDMQLKGAGKTQYSRQGDGRSALGPVLREYLICESMNALGIPTTRALAVVTSGEQVFRETVLPGAILTRVASSHVRVGTFEYFAVRKDVDAIRLLADYVIDRHYPDIKTKKQNYLLLLSKVVENQASLIAQWMLVGFIHGVMNTDNTAVSGETIDFGPCAFMDSYHPKTVFSSIDRFGRYAYVNQPGIAFWNLARFAETLLPIIDPSPDRAVQLAKKTIEKFPEIFENKWLKGMRKKIGLFSEDVGDQALIAQLLTVMEENALDFTVTFRSLCDSTTNVSEKIAIPDEPPESLRTWLSNWRSRIAKEKVDPRARSEMMRKVNPFCIPRNHRVEQVLNSATTELNFEPFESLLNVLLNPYQESEFNSEYSIPPKPEERILETFCGT